MEEEAAPAPVIVRIDHVMSAGYCVRGARAFCATHGLDFRRFLDEGVAAEVLEATGDWMALQVVEKARGQQ